jgi:hypothetical protein
MCGAVHECSYRSTNASYGCVAQDRSQVSGYDISCLSSGPSLVRQWLRAVDELENRHVPSRSRDVQDARRDFGSHLEASVHSRSECSWSPLGPLMLPPSSDLASSACHRQGSPARP